jgi:putative inorganic carbon (hco3(-)) transporter
LTPAGRLTRSVPAAAAWPVPAQLSGGVSFWLAAYVALLPFQIEPSPDLRLAMADAALFGYLIWRVSSIRLVRGAWSVWHLALVCLFAMGLFVTVSNSGALSRYVFLNKGLGLLTLLVAYAAITSEIGNWWQLRKVLRIFVLSVSFQNIIVMAALLSSYVAGVNFSFINYGNERLSGMMVDPNAYGGLLIVALAFNVVGSTGPIPVTRGFLRVVCDVTLAAGILFTFSRSAWIALGAAWLTFLLFRPKSALRMAAVVSTAIPVLLLFIGLGLLSPQRMLQRQDTIDSRVALIHDSLDQFKAHPLLGMGLGSFRESGGTIVHNTFLWFLADFGLAGAVTFIAFIAWFAMAGFRAYNLAPPEAQPYVLAAVVALVGMLGLSMGIEAFYQRHWWLSFALVGAASAIASKVKKGLPQAGGDIALQAPRSVTSQQLRTLARSRA